MYTGVELDTQPNATCPLCVRGNGNRNKNEFMGNDNNDTKTTTSEHRNKCPFLSYQSQSFLFGPTTTTARLVTRTRPNWWKNLFSADSLFLASIPAHRHDDIHSRIHFTTSGSGSAGAGGGLSYLRGRSQTFRIHKRMKIVISWMGLKFLINLNLTSFRCFLPLHSLEWRMVLSVSLVCDWLGDSIGLRNRTRHLVSL